MDWTIFWTLFRPFFFKTILSGGSTPLVQREGWDAVYQYTEEGLGDSVITQGGVRDEL